MSLSAPLNETNQPGLMPSAQCTRPFHGLQSTNPLPITDCTTGSFCTVAISQSVVLQDLNLTWKARQFRQTVSKRCLILMMMM